MNLRIRSQAFPAVTPGHGGWFQRLSRGRLRPPTRPCAAHAVLARCVPYARKDHAADRASTRRDSVARRIGQHYWIFGRKRWRPGRLSGPMWQWRARQRTVRRPKGAANAGGVRPRPPEAHAGSALSGWHCRLAQFPPVRRPSPGMGPAARTLATRRTAQASVQGVLLVCGRAGHPGDAGRRLRVGQLRPLSVLRAKPRPPLGSWRRPLTFGGDALAIRRATGVSYRQPYSDLRTHSRIRRRAGWSDVAAGPLGGDMLPAPSRRHSGLPQAPLPLLSYIRSNSSTSLLLLPSSPTTAPPTVPRSRSGRRDGCCQAQA